LSWRHADQFAKPPYEVTLVEEADAERDFRKRKPTFRQQLLRFDKPPLQ
jgi:hypothetical protein